MFIALLIMVTLMIVFFIKFQHRIPILMYHRIATVPGDRNSLPPEKFKEQLDYLKKHGYHTITLNDLYNHVTLQVPLPPKPVILTFDDGYEDNFSCALPLLKERDMKATVFPIVHWVGMENKWENFNKQLTQTMNWDHLKQWHAAGMEIGSHTLEHPFLTQCDEVRLEQELRHSKMILQEKLGAAIDFLCYPYGFFDNRATEIAKQCGYRGALAIFANAPLWNHDMYALPRIPISSRQPSWEFALKVSRFHILFIMLRKIERGAKWLRWK
ncbi:polysaccharide deacetylase family protein [Propionispora hippei]|uniref:Peptidoglycan/xylan/chitin deacetylase, PgdA/CDA1 family n=1 Tax=Propionispora hippei DSM 15287 TaxID=1123003 RepID=A0A1M6K3N3_9FIRM|nr:polysaccharide deacetylase family protein [Propionispora hippei]SHJ53593.1 Peptidoglycan/xylan/chitin deacetylase, PgdA/CDA1 family [Propionispora hippei DSM 15287]